MLIPVILSSIVDEVVVSTMGDMAAVSPMGDRVAVPPMGDKVAVPPMGDRVAVSPMGDRVALSPNLVVNEILRPGRSLIKSTVSLNLRRGRASPVLATGQGKPCTCDGAGQALH